MSRPQTYPLAAFERYMLMDDQDAFSMTCHIRFWFDGELQRPAFENALVKALERHPFLTSRLEEKRHLWGVIHAMKFIPVSINLAEILDWQQNFDQTAADRILRGDMRLRFLVRVMNGKSLFVVKFHHSSSDGIGIFQFFEDLMLFYDAELKGTTADVVQLDNTLLERRYYFGLSIFGWIKRLHLDLARLSRFFNKFPTPMLATRIRDPKEISDPGAAVRIVVPFAWMKDAQAAAKSLDVTFNDLMISRLLSATVDWNRTHGKSISPNAVFRMNVPISLRTADEERMPACNYVSMVFLDRRPRELDDESSVVRSMAAEMNQVKRDRMGLTLIMSVAAMMRARVFEPIFRSSMCMTTLGLTNLGQPFRNFKLADDQGRVCAGNVTLTGLDTFPPVRRNTLATLSVNRYGGQLSMTVRYDSTSWRADDAREFLNRFMTTLSGRSINENPPEGLIVQG